MPASKPVRLLIRVGVLVAVALSGVNAAEEAAKAESAFKVSHAPKQPKTGDRVAITVEAPGPVKTDDLALEYQVVEPGKYIDLQDPAYTQPWTRLPLIEGTRDKAAPMRVGLKAELPPQLQMNRRLIRYRIYSSGAKAVVAPAADDPQPNFAYFVYDGIPAWRAAINPNGSEQEKAVETFPPKVMGSVQAYHLITKQSSVENITWLEPKSFMSSAASEYKYTATLVANGKVYDHVRLRARGGNWRYAMGKNMWKIDFLKGHHLEARDNWGEKYKTRWGKLNLGACIQQGDYGMRGEQGMFEAVTFRLFNLAGVEAPHTHWVQLRIVDAPEETPANQYRGDFWGLYLALENLDDNFLEEHGLPDGNLYKMDLRGPEPQHLAPGAPADRADVLQFMSELRRNPDAAWWRTNVDLPRYYSYRSTLECVHHYDIGMGKNYSYFHRPDTKRWQVVPWDVDLTWSDQMFGNAGEPFVRAGLLQAEPFKTEYETRLTEIRDLLFNEEQTGALIDEYAAVISTPDGGSSMVKADRAKWDYHPIMSSRYTMRGKSDPGLFYKSSPTHDFEGMTQLMKQYVDRRGEWIDRTFLADARLPATPTIAPAKKLDESASKVNLQLASPATAAKVKWRLAESSLAGKDTERRKYEIAAIWEAEGGASAEIPTKGLENGHTYRVRARVQDGKGHWSHWSAPTQFTVLR